MRIAVIGAGVVGVTTAWELAADGHRVTVLERRSSVAEETSFANAGVIAPGYVTPWAAPGMPAKVLGGLFAAHSAVRFGAGVWRCLPWLRRYLAACARPVHEANRRAMQALARYSRERLETLARRQDIDYEPSRGYLVLLRDEREFARAQAGLQLLRDTGTAARLLDAAACREVEPGLAPETPLRAGIHLPDDGVGNCRLFAQQLRALAQGQGVEFRFGAEVLPLDPAMPLQLRWHAAAPQGTAPGPLRQERFDAVVLCAGVPSAALAHPTGLRLPLLPVYGYSLTAPLRETQEHSPPPPQAGLMDERYKVAITRLGRQLRVAGSAELGARADRMNPASQRTLYKVLQDWFPAAADLGRARLWRGGRPMLPDGPPVVGESPVPGLWLNLGHGSSGWALACGSARALADQLGDRTPEIDTRRLSYQRLLGPGVEP